MSRDPITGFRGKWQVRPVPASMARLVPYVVVVAQASTVDGGRLRVFVAREPGIGLHLSISYVDRCGDPTRYPTWDEIADARDQLLPADVGFIMHLPPRGEYVAVHPTTFHLHEHPAPSGVGS